MPYESPVPPERPTGYRQYWPDTNLSLRWVGFGRSLRRNLVTLPETVPQARESKINGVETLIGTL